MLALFLGAVKIKNFELNCFIYKDLLFHHYAPSHAESLSPFNIRQGKHICVCVKQSKSCQLLSGNYPSIHHLPCAILYMAFELDRADFFTTTYNQHIPSYKLLKNSRRCNSFSKNSCSNEQRLKISDGSISSLISL